MRRRSSHRDSLRGRPLVRPREPRLQLSGQRARMRQSGNRLRWNEAQDGVDSLKIEVWWARSWKRVPEWLESSMSWWNLKILYHYSNLHFQTLERSSVYPSWLVFFTSKISQPLLTMNWLTLNNPKLDSKFFVNIDHFRHQEYLVLFTFYKNDAENLIKLTSFWKRFDLNIFRPRLSSDSNALLQLSFLQMLPQEGNNVSFLIIL